MAEILEKILNNLLEPDTALIQQVTRQRLRQRRVGRRLLHPTVSGRASRGRPAPRPFKTAARGLPGQPPITAL
ncbi:hypothetical protein chiPu_0023729 [Chiloscyllium punctatum]|uniref:Uncharacterized protein n=1 Tax=Chiloscyllium punctatum TaxID=137246 RepID=A0A401TB33_CHIPU|nr:hypothetical protein [Chiloscyllium punctatum]